VHRDPKGGLGQQPFFLVARWPLVGYIVIAGMIELAFIRDHTPGPQLAAVS
jgi:hypothetical protein